MAVGLPSKELYRTSIQEDLNLYSSSASALKKCYADMNVCKGEWAQTVKDLPNLSDSKKEEIFNTALTNYHTFIKTAEFASNLFERLQANCIRCTRPEISPDTYITMIGLGENAEIFRQKAEALATIRDHLETLSIRIQTVLKGDIDMRLPQIVVPLEQLIGAIRPPLAGWSIGGWRTPALNAAYENWISNASDAQKNWKPQVDENIVKSASFGSVEPSFGKLNRALQTLNLTYVDPETKIGYGAASNQELPKSLGKEEEPSRTVTAAENDLFVQPEKDNPSFFSDDFSVNSSLLLDANQIDATDEEVEEEEFEVRQDITKTKGVPLSDCNSQQLSPAEIPEIKDAPSSPIAKPQEDAAPKPSKSPILEKKAVPSSPIANLQEDAFEVLERLTKKIEKEDEKQVSSIPAEQALKAENSSSPAQQEKPPVVERKNIPSSPSKSPAQPQKKVNKGRAKTRQTAGAGK